MLRYGTVFTVSQVAKILRVNRSLVTKWLFLFGEFFSKSATPPKGTTRQLNLIDVRIMAYIASEWHEEADTEDITYGLNCNCHCEEKFNKLMTSITPLFFDSPENLEEYPESGVLFSGLSQYSDILSLANAYKKAGDILIEAAIEMENQWEMCCPILYNYRHAIELYLKGALGQWKKVHEYTEFYNRFKLNVKTEFNEEIPGWFDQLILGFNEIDSDGSTFRYGGNVKGDEIFVDLRQLKTLMGWLSSIFKKIEYKKMYGELPQYPLH